MTNSFVKIYAFISLSIATLFLLAGCKNSDAELTTGRSVVKKVIVVGAGPAGLAAGYELQQRGIDFEILEATADFGGRIKKNTTFTKFPIDLGAEWIHSDQPKELLASLMSDKGPEDITVELIPYNITKIAEWNGVTLTHSSQDDIEAELEYKFKNTTWYDFFADNLVPSIENNIVYNSPVTKINYSSDRVVVETADKNYVADKVLVTVSLGVLKAGIIEFKPKLPQYKADAIAKVSYPAGLKVFLKFSSKFYPDLLELEAGMIKDGTLLAGVEKSYFDAAFNKNSDQNIMGLLIVGDEATKLTELGSDRAIYMKLLEELDIIFENKASRFFEGAIVQNWTKSPYVRGAYSAVSVDISELSEELSEEELYEEITSIAVSENKPLREKLAATIDNKVYFAGEAASTDFGSTVNEAALTAIAAVKAMDL